MPGGGDHGDDVDGEHPGVGEFDLNFVEGGAGVLGKRDAAEALAPDVLRDVEERDDSGDALGDVHPVSSPGVYVHVDATAESDEEAVEGVEGERDEDEGPLEHADEGEPIEELDLLGVGEGAVDGLVVGDDVFDEEGADGDDAGERVQPAPEEGVALAGSEGLDSSLDYRVGRGGRRCWRCGGGHGDSFETVMNAL